MHGDTITCLDQMYIDLQNECGWRGESYWSTALITRQHSTELQGVSSYVFKESNKPLWTPAYKSRVFQLLEADLAFLREEIRCVKAAIAFSIDGRRRPLQPIISLWCCHFMPTSSFLETCGFPGNQPLSPPYMRMLIPS